MKKLSKYKTLYVINSDGDLEGHITCTKVIYYPITRVVKAITKGKWHYCEEVFELEKGYKLLFKNGYIRIKF